MNMHRRRNEVLYVGVACLFGAVSALRAVASASRTPALAAGAWLLGAAGCAPEVSVASATTRERAVPRVEVEPLRPGPLPRPVRVSGLTRSRQTQSLSFKVGGVLSAVLVEPGQRVKRGQVLAMIDPAEYSASAAQAKDGLAKADRDLARASALSREGAIPKATLDDAATAANLARESARVATFNERHTLLVAPAAGVVESRLVEPGEVVAPGRPIVAFLGTERGWVVDVALSDREAASVSSGQEVRVVFDALPGATVVGKLGDVARVGSPATGTFKAEVLLPELLPLTIRSGLVARATLDRTEPASAVVPVGALVDGVGREAAVFLLEDGVARRRAVTVGAFADGFAALTTPLPASASVVVRGASELTDGAPVLVVETE
jgi:membrane fusion protein, multidrug efflux system